MKRTMIISLIATFVVACIAWLGLVWHQQATTPEKRLMVIQIPKWMAGSEHISYSIAIGKSQIKPYGTVWQIVEGGTWIQNFPVFDNKDLLKILRHRHDEGYWLRTGKRVSDSEIFSNTIP